MQHSATVIWRMITTTLVVVVGFVVIINATYITENNDKPQLLHHQIQQRGHQPLSASAATKSNSAASTFEVAQPKRFSPAFKTDKEIARYLKIYGVDLLLWRCKNAIQPYWNWKPLPFLELYCEVIGTIKKVSWRHLNKNIVVAPGSKHVQLVMPHLENGRYYSRWIDFRLRIYNATIRDTGLYTFTATSPSGYSDKQNIYVDISEKKKKKKKNKNKKNTWADHVIKNDVNQTVDSSWRT